MRLRDALRDSADNPVFIETIERRGYRWIGPLHPPEPAAEKSPVPEVLPKELPVHAAPLPIASSAWRKLIFVPPLLALLFAAWIFRPGNRTTQVGAKSVTPATRATHPPASREAEDFYLKGLFYWNKRTPESLNQAVDAFNPRYCTRSQLFRRIRRLGRLLQPAARILCDARA